MGRPFSSTSTPPRQDTPPTDWRDWLRQLFPRYLTDPSGAAVPFATFHADLWEWVWRLRPGESVPALLAVWPRGAGKSTNAELACAALAARGLRRYALYVSGTQDQANKHVASVADMLTGAAFAAAYPQAADRALNAFGYSKGWNVQRLTTASGFTVDAIGLDTATRGIKFESQRPDLIIFDDVDSHSDSTQTIERKLDLIRRSILPAGAVDVAVLFVQNLIHADGVMAQVIDGRAEMLTDRVVLGPYLAINDLAVDRVGDGWKIVGGVPTWEHLSIEACEREINRVGLTAFMAEYQHDVSQALGGLYDGITFRHCAPADVPDLVRAECWVDPAVTETDQSDACGVQIDGVAADGTIYRLWSWEQRAGPLDALTLAITKAIAYGCSYVGIETDQGGDVWIPTYREAARAVYERTGERAPRMLQDKAGAGHGPKAHRGARMVADYQHGRIVHVLGTHTVLERALRRFPVKRPFDLADAAYYSWSRLREWRPADRTRRRQIVGPRYAQRDELPAWMPRGR